jgi:hypothetical protein
MTLATVPSIADPTKRSLTIGADAQVTVGGDDEFVVDDFVTGDRHDAVTAPVVRFGHVNDCLADDQRIVVLCLSKLIH